MRNLIKLLTKPQKPAAPRPRGMCETPPAPSQAAFVTVLVIDASSSMESDDYPPSRLEAAKRGASAYLAHRVAQSAHDRIAVVSFRGNARVECPLEDLKDSARRIQNAIDSIAACGNTSIGAGLRAAEGLVLGAPSGWMTRLLGEPLRVALPSGHVKRLILLSDGGHNANPKPEPIADRLKAAGVQIDCVGIGTKDEVDEDRLRRLASSPDRYRFIADARELFEHYRTLAKSLTL